MNERSPPCSGIKLQVLIKLELESCLIHHKEFEVYNKVVRMSSVGASSPGKALRKMRKTRIYAHQRCDGHHHIGH